MDDRAAAASRRAFSFAFALCARSVSRRSASALALARFASNLGSPVDLTGLGGAAAFAAADPGAGASPSDRSTTPRYFPSADRMRYFGSAVYITLGAPVSRAMSTADFSGRDELRRHPASTSANAS